jgi:hypothetical protein
MINVLRTDPQSIWRLAARGMGASERPSSLDPQKVGDRAAQVHDSTADEHALLGGRSRDVAFGALKNLDTFDFGSPHLNFTRSGRSK